MSDYASIDSMEQFLGKLLTAENGARFSKPRVFTRGNERIGEFLFYMGPFQLVFQATVDKGNLTGGISNIAPALRERRVIMLRNFSTFTPGFTYLNGQEKNSSNPICLCLTETVPLLEMGPRFEEKEEILVSWFGICIDGKVLLPTHWTKEQAQAERKRMTERQNLLRNIQNNGEDVMSFIGMESDRIHAEVRKSLEEDGLFTKTRTYMMQSGWEPNCYKVLAEITGVEKLMNDYTNEWVYYLELATQHGLFRVLINPSDLLGEPKMGRRFEGTVRFYGRIVPNQLRMEEEWRYFYG